MFVRFVSIMCLALCQKSFSYRICRFAFVSLSVFPPPLVSLGAFARFGVRAEGAEASEVFISFGSESCGVGCRLGHKRLEDRARYGDHLRAPIVGTRRSVGGV